MIWIPLIVSFFLNGVTIFLLVKTIKNLREVNKHVWELEEMLMPRIQPHSSTIYEECVRAAIAEIPFLPTEKSKE